MYPEAMYVDPSTVKNPPFATSKLPYPPPLPAPRPRLADTVIVPPMTSIPPDPDPGLVATVTSRACTTLLEMLRKPEEVLSAETASLRLQFVAINEPPVMTIVPLS